MILKKKQSGGRLFAPAQLDFGARDFSGLLNQFDSGRAGRTSSGVRLPRTTAKSQQDVSSKGLPSDIAYYQQTKKEIESEIEDGFIADENFDQTKKYEALTDSLYSLTSSFVPTFETRKKQFEDARKRLRTEKASGMPAIMGDKVLVQSKDGSMEFLDDEQLLQSPEDYKMLTIREAADLRYNNPQFSGATTQGRLLDMVMEDAFGGSSFNDYIGDLIKQAGYTSIDGKLADNEKRIININDIVFEGTEYRSKSNQKSLNGLVRNFVTQADPAASNYVQGMALKNLYNKAARGEIDLEDKSPHEIEQMIVNNYESFVLKTILPSLKEEFELDGDVDGGGDGSDWTTKDLIKTKVPMNIFRFANLQVLGTGRESVESVPGVKEDSDMGSILYNIPSTKIPETNELLENKYVEFEGDDGNKIKTIGDNNLLRDIGDPSEATLANGVKLEDITDGGMQNITTNWSSNIRLIIAPVIDGKVTFDIPQNNQVVDLVKELEEELKKVNLTPEDIQTNSDSEVVQDIRRRINQKASKIPNSNISFDLAVAFDVYMPVTKEAERQYDMFSDASSVADKIKSRITDPIRNKSRYKSAKAFMPVSSSFYKTMADANKYNTKGDYSLAEIRAITTTQPQGLGSQSQDDVIKDVTKKEDGGKIPTAEEIKNILF
jgi:hypothetical protein